MHEGKRPGGLTALAVFNFIGTGVDLFQFLIVLGMLAFGGKLADMTEAAARKQAAAQAKQEGRDPAQVELTPQDRQTVAALRAYETDRVSAVVQAVSIAACVGLLLAAGIGYLKQRSWGRILGNLYVLASVASTVHAVRMVPPEYGGGLRFAVLLSFVYPVLTLYLVNGTFREDLKR